MNVIKAIKQRQTFKVLSNQALPAFKGDVELIETLMESAYWAPFHKPCAMGFQTNGDHLVAIMPWRFYILDAIQCRELVKWLKEMNVSMGKVEEMLNSADYLIQTTWTPNAKQSLRSDELYHGDIDNMEHIAAASAAVQNMLLTATSLDIVNYWSSGGVLRGELVFEKLGINLNEILLGSIFLFPCDENCHKRQTEMADLTIGKISSKLRDKRGSLQSMYQFVNVFDT